MNIEEIYSAIRNQRRAIVETVSRPSSYQGDIRVLLRNIEELEKLGYKLYSSFDRAKTAV